MIDLANIRKGTQVYGDNNQLFGTVERINGQDIYISGQSYPVSSFSRFEQNRLYMGGQQSNATLQQNDGTITVPVVEEQINVGKRQVELGEVEVQKTVTQQQVSVPVELRREEVNVQEIDVPDRPIAANEANAAFQEGTIRVPVRGEQAVVSKQAVVTGEVVVNKDVTAEQQQIADTVRKEHVTVEDSTVQPQTQVATQQVATQQVATQQATPMVETAAYTSVRDETNVTADGTAAYVSASDDVASGGYATASTGSFDQTQLQEDMEVYSSDDHHLGKIKEVTGDYFLVGRGLFKGSIEASYASVQQVDSDRVILNLTKDQVDALS